MQNTIRFQGLSLTPDEHAAPSGSLAVCAGVEMHDGALRPSVVAGTSVATPLLNSSDEVVTLIFVHETPAYRHFIGQRGQVVYWFASDGTLGGTIHSFSSGVTIRSVNATGNTLVFVADDAIHYAAFKDTTYNYIGTKPPFLRLQFDVSSTYKAKYDRSTMQIVHEWSTSTEYENAWRQLSFKSEDYFEVKSGPIVTCKSEKQSELTEGLWALINMANHAVAEEGHFYAPFMVRYCYRLYDGAMIMHSSPVYIPVTGLRNYKVYLMNAIYDLANITLNDDVNVNDGYATMSASKTCLRYQPANVALKYRLIDNGQLSELRTNWADVVKSVDIFITPPITREESDKTIETGVVESSMDWRYVSSTIMANVNTWVHDPSGSYPVILDIPMISIDKLRDKIRNQSSFYRIHSFNLETDTISTTFTELPADKSAIENVATQDKMTDDYKTHNQLMPIPERFAGSYVYNKRLSLYGLQERLFSGFDVIDMMPHILTDYSVTNLFPDVVEAQAVYVELATDQGRKTVHTEGATYVNLWALRNLPVFYPDNRAEKMVIKTSSNYLVLPLKSCPEINGGMYVGSFNYMNDTTTITTYTPTLSDIVTLPNKIYTSKVDNPYYFPPESINTVGVGSIMGIAAVTRALSAGESGKFPLMAFSTDGIWALTVTSTGAYAVSHNISREVPSNPESIVQLDQSVVFVTARALNKCVEDNVASLSDMLDGPWFDCVGRLPQLLDICGDYPSLLQMLGVDMAPVDFFQSCHVVYDYASSRLLLVPQTTTQDSQVPVFVYSTRDLMWSLMLMPKPLACINSNPYPYVQGLDGTVTCLDKIYPIYSPDRYPGLIVTRSLQLAETMATIKSFAQMHDSFEKTLIAFWGSHDNVNWRYIGKTTSIHNDYVPSHSFRFFRLAVLSCMAPGERYMSVKLVTNERYRKY